MDAATLSERLGRIDERLQRIERAVTGNGQPGLEQRVSGLERWRAGIVAVVSALTFATGALIALAK
jgi:hypothetical protein